MKLTLKKEDTGNYTYVDDTKCPIACALKDAGFTSVRVGPYDWSSMAIVSIVKTYLFFFKRTIEKIIRYEGVIPNNINESAKKWSRESSQTDIEFELPEPTLTYL